MGSQIVAEHDPVFVAPDRQLTVYDQVAKHHHIQTEQEYDIASILLSILPSQSLSSPSHNSLLGELGMALHAHVVNDQEMQETVAVPVELHDQVPCEQEIT
jgi:hypothetical protein